MKTWHFIIDFPWVVVFLCLVPVIAGFTFLPKLLKDIRSDAFLADDNPALVYKQKVKAEFGLSDPLVVAVVDKSSVGVFNVQTLALIQSLTEEISSLPNIDESRVVSLATEKNIAATAEGMNISPFFEDIPGPPEALEALRQAVFNFPLYLGNLVSTDGSVTLIIAEMIDEGSAGESYQNIVGIVDGADLPPDVQLHVAGEGAIIGYLGEYVDADARQLVPFCGLVIALILIIAFRGILPAFFTIIIVVATLSIVMGTMAAVGVPFYVITNALPVVLIGISVADAIHIYMHYFDLQVAQPDKEIRSLVLDTVEAMWRPITLTSLTTMAGFLGLYFAAYMPPFKYFGLFAALGVMVAWFYSLYFLPAVMVLAKTRVSKKYIQRRQKRRLDTYSHLLSAVGRMTLRYSRIIICFYAVIAAWGLYAASHLIIDENPLNVFHPDEPVVQADRVINEHLNGTNTLDIVIETPASEDLFDPDNLRTIEALQTFLETLPHVGGSISIVDYLKQMNRALNGGDPDEYRLPETREAVAQYFLIYSATSDPTDFEEEVDYDYKTANIRVNIKSGDYQDVKIIVEALNEYIDKHVNDDAIKATLSGRVNVHYRWISELARSHFIGLAVAVLLVLMASALLFRSLVGGVLTLLPVACAVLLVYALMGVTGITLGMGTSMFAAVAVGLGIDYSIHTLERMGVLYNETGQDMEATFRQFYPTTGKTLLFNFLAIAGGFGVLTVSKISSLNIFGAIIVLAVSASFIASMTLLPALLNVFVPSFMRQAQGHSTPVVPSGMSAILFGMIAMAATTLYSPLAEAVEQGLSSDKMHEAEASGAEMLSAEELFDPAPPEDQMLESIASADEVVAMINAVPEGEYVSRQIEMLMTDRRGKQRNRKTISFRKTYEDQRRTVLFYLEPANVRDTGFLIWDYTDPAEDDDQWLYLPALRKVRRISASDRGDYFLGTDFTYEDMKLNGKLEPLDYNFSLLGIEELDGIESYKLEAKPKDEKIATELGYSSIIFWVNPANWMILRAEFWDLKGQPLKTLTIPDIRRTGGIWTRHKLQLENHQTGHRTEFAISHVDYATEVQDDLFTKRALERGR